MMADKSVAMKNKDTDIDIRERKELLTAFKRADRIVTKEYLSYLDQLPVKPVPNDGYNMVKHSRFIKIGKMVYDKNENNIRKLTNVYAAMSAINANVALIIQSDGNHVDFYAGICDGDEQSDCATKIEALYNNIKGNFPGSIGLPLRSEDINIKRALLFDDDLKGVINGCFKASNAAISSVSGIASVRQEDAEKNAEFTQGIEKMLEAMRGNAFSAIFMARALSKQELLSLKAEYECLYTKLVPFSKSVLTMSQSEADGVSKTLSNALSDSVGSGKSTALSVGESKSTAHTEGESIGKTNTGGVNAGIHFGGKEKPGGYVGASYSHSETRTQSFSDTMTFGTSKTETKTETVNKNHTVTVTEADGTQTTYSLGKTLQLNYENKSVTALLENIEEQLKRIKATESFGMFAAAAYFIAPSKAISTMAASAHKSIISGSNTCVETAVINTWDGNGYEKIEKYLTRLQHPTFLLEDGSTVTAASVVSGQELAIQFSFPKKSLSGLPVVECAEFGRNVMSAESEYKGDLRLGNIYNMLDEEKTPVSISSNDLVSHTFVTGSTGAGKSNTVFSILNKLREGVNFLVVEPAKGEYKDVFGGNADVAVYGTNPKVTELLRIDPFSFPENVSVSEHIDRLVELFNVCWPMYAAMPAVLKDAVIRAYEAAGWNMETSENYINQNLYPTFSDVLAEIRQVLKESDYSADNKGDYTGALVTRLKSLTNGIYRYIFTSDELGCEELFDKNVIVDLSRVGSTETKSLIMGLLVMKLQEYRLSKGMQNGGKLKHITVLEEAHNLLKRTSTEQMSESSNLLGKSVEMLANSIAELRAFGEGFIIADQSPGLLDMSVIRNTNTKIIHRLPDFSDRELVGKAATLNEEQIKELAKLPLGVAAVYQNNWIEPVLCKVEKFENINGVYKYTPTEKRPDLKNYFYKLFDMSGSKKLSPESADAIREWIKSLNVSVYTKSLLESVADGTVLSDKQRAEVAYNVFNGQRMGFILQNNSQEGKGIEDMHNNINNMFHIRDEGLTKVVQELILQTILNNLESTELAARYTRFLEGRGMM